MTPLSWPVTATAGLICSWIDSPPVSTAGRAAWAALGIGFLGSVALLAFHHRAVLVIALPIAAVSAPLAVIRRHRAGAQTQEIPAGRRRIVLAISGALLFAFGVNVAVLNEESTWARPLLILGAAIVGGIVPFHRPSTETLRAAPADIRTPAILMLGPALWIPLARWIPPAAWGSLSSTLPLLTLWLGAFLVLARGDLPRLVSATYVFVTGQIAMTALAGPGLVMPVAGSITAPLMMVVLLISKLERNSGTREVAELGGLARRLPRLSIALLAALFWLLGTAAAPATRTLIEHALQGRPLTTMWAAIREVWPVYIPQVVAVWGWLLVLRDLLVGPDRTPQFPEPLRDRVSAPQADRPLEDLTIRELAAIIVFAVVAAVG
jgi:NADH:ubiquinone oxidoreductase subunit 4 (subunit M)